MFYFYSRGSLRNSNIIVFPNIDAFVKMYMYSAIIVKTSPYLTQSLLYTEIV